MTDSTLERDVLRYSRQIVLKAMDRVRTSMRGSDRLTMKEAVESPETDKSEENLTKAIDKETEDLMLAAVRKKFAKIRSLGGFTLFSEEKGICSYPLNEGGGADADLVVFMDPIDGTEFAETLQGGWCLMAVYDRSTDGVLVAVAGDIFLDRLYWASRSGDAEALDFITHSWFRLDGGPNPKATLEGARINVLTTKVDRYLAIAGQAALLEELRRAKARINLSWGSNSIIQVAAGYADVALEFAKGFATYDILPGLFIAEKAGLTIIDPEGRPVTSTLDLDAVFSAYRKNPKKPLRTPFIAAKNPALAQRVAELLQ